MYVGQLKVNQIHNPLGFKLDTLSFSFVADSDVSSKQSTTRIEVSTDESFHSLVFDTGYRKDISSTSFMVDMPLLPRCRYFWRVSVIGDMGDHGVSSIAWFETAKNEEPWLAKWISPIDGKADSAIFCHRFDAQINNPIVKARLYICGLGCYEIYLNGQRAGNEYLAPGFHAYDKWLQYQTYDVSDVIESKDNVIEVLVGNGWYKGRLGFNHGGEVNHYGDQLALICELILTYQNGDEQVITTDESWCASQGYIQENGIYDGECIDRTQVLTFQPVQLNESLTHRDLSARYSLPVVCHDVIEPQEVISLDDHQVILDFGQNISGWVEFDSLEKAQQTVTIQYAEVMQDGNVFTENLRSAKAEFKYISDGKFEHVRPHFTFYGFRYVKILGIEVEDVQHYRFTACHIYSNIKRAAWIKTSNSTVNQFVENVIRSQKDNFVDVPTDCPQRDERMGWTGDIQVFSSAACMNMDVYAFLSKYLIDLAKEQTEMNGAVPFIVPMFDVKEAGSSAWGDAATVLPWNMWLHYGDDTVLKRQYSSMKAWVDFILDNVKQQDSDCLLWDSGFHFGDWLALDNEPWIKSFKGKTEDKFIASIYFHYSAMIVGKAAEQLGKIEDAKIYQQMALDIMQALRKEYLTSTGKLALDTQTAYILAIMFDVYPKDHLERANRDFSAKLARDQYQIRSGFVGTPYFCRALTKVGLNDIAYRMFLNVRSPSWLFPVTVGATTIWERWDSMDEMGRMNPDSSMNSLNHYAFGSVIDWLYKDVCGLNPSENGVGFKYAIVKPHPNYRLNNIELTANTAAGQYHLVSNIQANNTLELSIRVPFDCVAEYWLPDISNINQLNHNVSDIHVTRCSNALIIKLPAGNYHFSYCPDIDYVPKYSIAMPIRELMSNVDINNILNKYIPDVMALPFIDMINGESLASIAEKPFFNYQKKTLSEIEKEVSKYVVC